MHPFFGCAKVLLLFWMGLDLEPSYHVAEFFAGKGEASQAFREAGMLAASYDWEYAGKAMNFLEPGGYAPLSCTCYQL